MSAPDPPPEPEQPDKPKPRRRLPRWAILSVILVAAYFVLPSLPRDHQVVLRLEDPSSVVGVELDWSPAQQGEPFRGGSWRFDPGHAPHTVTSNVRVPNGDYSLKARVFRQDRADEVRRVVTLGDAESITVPLR